MRYSIHIQVLHKLTHTFTWMKIKKRSQVNTYFWWKIECVAYSFIRFMYFGIMIWENTISQLLLCFSCDDDDDYAFVGKYIIHDELYSIVVYCNTLHYKCVYEYEIYIVVTYCDMGYILWWMNGKLFSSILHFVVISAPR